MYVIVAKPSNRTRIICCPIQDAGTRIGMTEVELPLGYDRYIVKDSKVLCHEIYTVDQTWFLNKVGSLKLPAQDKLKTALIGVLSLS